MKEDTLTKYPVFVMCGRDVKRRKMMTVLDPEEKYKAKAMLPFLGKRLIDWQLDELRKSLYADGIYILGLSQEDLPFDFPVDYVPVEMTSNPAEKFAAGVAYLKKQGKNPDLIVISTCDAPGIRQAEIDLFFESLKQLGSVDFVQSLVPEAVGEAAFPNSGRVVARFRDVQAFPGELYALSPKAITIGNETIREISDRRRQINRSVKKISLGPMIRFIAKRPQTWLFILKYALKLATLKDGERALSAAFGCKVRGVIIPEAGFGMDMDLPEDYARLEAFVRRTKLEKKA
jgi:CTP:molybdopterin cytidylyltransferase MocA